MRPLSVLPRSSLRLGRQDHERVPRTLVRHPPPSRDDSARSALHKLAAHRAGAQPAGGLASALRRHGVRVRPAAVGTDHHRLARPLVRSRDHERVSKVRPLSPRSLEGRRRQPLLEQRKGSRHAAASRHRSFCICLLFLTAYAPQPTRARSSVHTCLFFCFFCVRPQDRDCHPDGFVCGSTGKRYTVGVKSSRADAPYGTV